MSYNNTNVYYPCDKCNIKKSCNNCKPVESVNYLYTNTGLRALQARYHSDSVYAGVGDASSNEPHYSSSDMFYKDLHYTPQFHQEHSYANIVGVGEPVNDNHYASSDNLYRSQGVVVMQNTQPHTVFINTPGVGGPVNDVHKSPSDNIYSDVSYNTSNVCVENFTHVDNDVETELSKKLNFNIIQN